MLLTRDSASHPDGRVQLAKRAWLRVQHARARRAVRKGRERHAANHAQRLVVSLISFTLDRCALRRSLGRSLGRPLMRGGLRHLEAARLRLSSKRDTGGNGASEIGDSADSNPWVAGVVVQGSIVVLVVAGTGWLHLDVDNFDAPVQLHESKDVVVRVPEGHADG